MRDEILQTFAELRAQQLDADSASPTRSRTRATASSARLDNTDAIAATIARFARFERSYDTLNKYYRELATAHAGRRSRTTAQKYFTDKNLVVTTLSQEPLPEAIAQAAVGRSPWLRAATAGSRSQITLHRAEVGAPAT